MTQPPVPPSPPGVPDDEDFGDEEFIEFVLGPRDNADGTPAISPEENRRLKSLQYLVKLYAEKYGIPLGEPEHPAGPITPSNRAAEIKQQANPEMARASAEIKRTKESSKIESPSGLVVEQTRTETHARINLGVSLEGLATFAKAVWTGGCRTIRIGIKVGKWIKAKVTVGPPDDDDPGDEDEDS